MISFGPKLFSLYQLQLVVPGTGAGLKDIAGYEFVCSGVLQTACSVSYRGSVDRRALSRPWGAHTSGMESTPASVSGVNASPVLPLHVLFFLFWPPFVCW